MPLNYSTNLGPLDKFKNNLSFLMRQRTFELFMRTCAPSPSARVADFGVSGHRDHQAHYFFELLYPHTERLTAIGRAEEDADWMAEAFPGLTFLEADLRRIPVPDLYFDAGLCNAVLEHAGSYDQQQLLVREVCRVCRVVMFTTPNRYFPLELHTLLPVIHWLPDAYFRSILRFIGRREFATVDNLNPLDMRTLLSLFPTDRRNQLIKLGPPLLSSNLVCVSSAVSLGPSSSAAPGVESRGCLTQTDASRLGLPRLKFTE